MISKDPDRRAIFISEPAAIFALAPPLSNDPRDSATPFGAHIRGICSLCRWLDAWRQTGDAWLERAKRSVVVLLGHGRAESNRGTAHDLRDCLASHGRFGCSAKIASICSRKSAGSLAVCACSAISAVSESCSEPNCEVERCSVPRNRDRRAENNRVPVRLQDGKQYGRGICLIQQVSQCNSLPIITSLYLSVRVHTCRLLSVRGEESAHPGELNLYFLPRCG